MMKIVALINVITANKNKNDIINQTFSVCLQLYCTNQNINTTSLI